MKKIEKMVAAYNRYAAKHGFSTISVDYANCKIIGEFTPKNEDQFSGFWGFFKNMNIAGQNGYLKGDYEKIEKALKKLSD